MDKTNQLQDSRLRLPSITEGFDRALKAAACTLGATAPNPSVGCTLLDRNGTILAVGAHPQAGAPHAEIMALNAAREAGLYEQIYAALVTLEPCAHHGLTPPCAVALKESPVEEVWIGLKDPNPKAMGGSVILQQGDKPKKVFLLEELGAKDPLLAEISEKCRALVLPFLTRIALKRPWITVKQALTEEGSMIPPKGQKTFTSPCSLQKAHLLRKSVDAIITGIGTVLADHPSFSVRHVKDHATRSPRLLIVMDRHDRLPMCWKKEREHDHFIVKTCPDLNEAKHLLHEMDINWALIEAGPTLLKTIEQEEFWDEWWVIQKRNNGQDDLNTLTLRHETHHKISPLQLMGTIGRS